MQHVFHNDYTLEVRYLGTRGRASSRTDLA